jgi:hypothetical protein
MMSLRLVLTALEAVLGQQLDDAWPADVRTKGTII